LFRDPSIAALARMLEEAHPSLVSLLNELENLSAEETLRLLEQEE